MLGAIWALKLERLLSVLRSKPVIYNEHDGHVLWGSRIYLSTKQ